MSASNAPENGIDSDASCPSSRRSISLGEGRQSLPHSLARPAPRSRHARISCLSAATSAGSRQIEPCLRRTQLVMLDAAGQHAHRREHAGRRREHHARNAERPCQVAGMHRPRAAEGEQRQFARIEAALDGDGADGANHIGVGDLADAIGRGLDGEAERGAERLADRSPRRLDVELQGAARQPGRQVAEHDIGVGHRRPRAAQPVADRTRVRRPPKAARLSAGRRRRSPRSSRRRCRPRPHPPSAPASCSRRP